MYKCKNCGHEIEEMKEPTTVCESCGATLIKLSIDPWKLTGMVKKDGYCIVSFEKEEDDE